MSSEKAYHHIEQKDYDRLLITRKRCGIGQPNADLVVNRTAFYSYCNIHLILHGEMEIQYEGTSYIGKKGDWFILPPYKKHTYKVLMEETNLKWIEFVGGESELLAKQIMNQLKGPLITFNHQSDDHIRSVLDSVIRDSEMSCYKQSSGLYELLMLLLEHAKTVKQTGKNPDLLTHITHYIEQHLHQPLKLEELARVTATSISTLNRCFKKTFQMTPTQYIYMRRIVRAKRFLTDTEDSLEVIAHTCGFYDAPHLIHRFHESEGVTPQGYRDEIKSYNKSAY